MRDGRVWQSNRFALTVKYAFPESSHILIPKRLALLRQEPCQSFNCLVARLLIYSISLSNYGQLGLKLELTDHLRRVVLQAV